MDHGKLAEDERARRLTEMAEAYQGMLLRLCYVYLHDQELAKDAVQETFLKAYRGMDSFRGECSIKTWLIRIAVNTCRSMRRSAWFRYHDRSITPEDIPRSAAAIPGQDLDMMCEVMRLPGGLKEIIILYYWQNMNVSEIAQALGVAQSTVSRRLMRAREKLRDMLERREQYDAKGKTDRAGGV